MKVSELPGRGRTGGVVHQVLTTLGLGKGDHIPDVGAVGEDADNAVKAKGDSPVGWRPVAEGVQHVSKALLDNLGWDLEDILENVFLKLRLMDTD